MPLRALGAVLPDEMQTLDVRMKKRPPFGEKTTRRVTVA